MIDPSSYQKQSKTLEEALKDTKKEKDDTETLDEKIREAEQKIIEIKSIYERYAMKLKDYAIMLETYKDIKEVDKESVPLFCDLIETMESIPILSIGLKTYILLYIMEVVIDAKSHPDQREEIIQNLRKGIEILKNKEGLLKMNELYYLILERVRKIDELYRSIHLEMDPKIERSLIETEFMYYDYLGVIIEGLLRKPTKYEPLYKRLIKTNNLEEFFKYLQKEYKILRPKKT